MGYRNNWDYQITLPASWEICMQVKKQHLEPDIKQQIGSKLEKNYFKAVYCHSAYLTFAEYIMQNIRLDESQAGIKIARRNINSLRHADDTTLMAESEEDPKRLLMKVKQDWVKKLTWNSTLKTTKVLASSPITSWQIEGEKMEAVIGFIFLGSKIIVDIDCSHEIKTLTPWKESYDKPR